MGQVKANSKPTVTDFAYLYVEDGSGGFRRLSKAQLKELLGDGSGGGSGSYTLPQASDTQLGGIKADTKGSGDTVPAKIGTDNKLYVPTYPTALKNPQKLKFAGAITAEYDGSGAVTVTIPEGSGGTSGTTRIEKQTTDTTAALDPNKLYVFPQMTNLAVTLAAPTDNNIVNEYHFVFQSGATPTTLTLPGTVKTGDFKVEANKVYELSIMESCLTWQSWEVA